MVADNLAESGHTVTILHRGTHEVPQIERYEHIHGDPHFENTLRSAIDGRTFDVVVAMYGRLVAIADVVSGRCGHLVAITGSPAYRGWFGPHRLHPEAMRIRARETDATVDSIDSDPARQLSFQHKIHQAEQRVLSLGSTGAFSSCVLRYPHLYGPRQIVPFEWRVIKRVLDHRPFMVIPENGLAIYTRCYAQNASRAVLLAVSQPGRADGQIFNCGDDDQFSVRQWLEMILARLGSRLELVSLPDDLAGPGRALNPLWGQTTHGYLDTSKLVSVLGYEDAVPALTALHRTVDWYLENPPQWFKPPDFDYGYEDRAVAGYRELVANVRRESGFEAPTVHHPYAHPRQPGLAFDENGR
jgi:nucleoside-diphosphate-sugar epimerase